MTTANDTSQVVIDHTIGARGRLTIHLAAAELRLLATDGDRVVVRMPNGSALPDRVVVETVDGGLTIREKETLGLTFAIGRKVVQLEVDVPAGAEVAIDSASGWLDGLGLRGEQRYRTASGDTRLHEGAGRIELNTVSGDATIELADATELAIKSVSGDVEVRGARLSGLRIGTTSGDVRVDSPLVGRSGNTIETLSGDVSVVATTGLRVEARTVSGDVTTDLPHRSEGRMGRRTLIVGDGSIELAFRSVSGDLRILDGSGTAAAGGFTGPTRPSAPDAPRRPAMPSLPGAPSRPTMPRLPGLPATPGSTAIADDMDGHVDPTEAERMAVLRALEQGELDVPTAMARLAVLDASSEPDVDRGSSERDPGPADD